LESELIQVEEEGYFFPADRLETLFVGGGTPSLLDPEAMAGLGRILGGARLADRSLEWSAEANPESFGDAVARAWASAGVNRVSLGAQSFQPGVLRWLGRRHGPEETRRAVERARAAGIHNLSLDLIFGLPSEVSRDWRLDLDSALALGVPHLSLYGLSVEDGTPLATAVRAGEVSRPDEEQYEEEFLLASDLMRSQGYVHYEVSNFALPGFEARHNRKYWEMEPYLGLGNSAHSFRFPRRRWNLREWTEYQDACRDNRAAWASEELLTPEKARLERIWLGLRTDAGIPVEDLGPEALHLAETWRSEGLAVDSRDTLRLTPQGWLFLDDLVVRMDLAQGRDL
jgi:oxygen-independent coproporphyrinogen-3 oxidase